MALDFEYGINTGNRFLNFVDHDEDPDEFIARQTQPDEKSKKSKDTKPVATTASKKTTTIATSANATNASNKTTRTNKENLTGKSTNIDQRRQQTNVLSDNNNQQHRVDSGRGGGRGFPRRGGSAGQDRPPYEGGGRGGGQQRSQRFNKFEGQQSTKETGGFEQSGEGWGNETGNDNQTFGGYRGRGRGRGGPRRGNFEGGRGSGRGRGRGGRGNFSNRNFEEGSQQPQQQQTQEGSAWQQSTDSNFDNTRAQSARTGGQELDTDVSMQERPFEPDSTRRGGRGFRSRTFHNNRNYGGDRQSQQIREGGQDDYRHNRRQHDRQPRTNVSSVKPIEKKDGEGAHNWGNPTENPDEHPVPEEITEATGQGASTSKDWAQQVDEAEKAEKQMTLDEYKKQIQEKKRAQQEKVPQFNRRTAGEGEDPKNWQKFEQEYRKKNEGEESEDEELEEGSGDEENGSEEENEEEQISGKKKIITIPLHFKPIELPRGGPSGSRGGPRRGSGRFRDRPNRDDQQRSKSPSQQQPPFYQQTGEYQNDEQQQQQQSRQYRGGPRQGSGRNEYRRSYGNSARGSRGGYNRSNADPNTPDFDNTVDFPTLPKQ